MIPKIVLLNGPPHCGKDSIAEGLLKIITMVNTSLVKFATPLKSAAREIYCDGDQSLFNHMDLPENKGKPNDLFFGKSCRQVQIDISEHYAKQMHGKYVFGKILANTIKKRSENGTKLFIVSDSGFYEEAEELAKQFGSDNMLLFRIHREGCSFDGDSRSYVDLKPIFVNGIDVDNKNGQLNQTISYIYGKIHNAFLKEENNVQ